MNTKLLQALVNAITAIVAVKLADYLADTSQLSPLMLVIVAASVATVVGTLLEEGVVFAKRRIRAVRKQLDSRSRFEGVWIVQVFLLEQRPYAYVTIDYNAEADAYSIAGASFDTKGKLQSTWTCPKVDFDLARNEIRYVAEAQLIDSTEVSSTYAHINFEKVMFGMTHRYSRGKGFFVDFGTQSRSAHFICDRLDSKTVKKMIGKRQVVSHQDMAKLVVDLHKKIGSSSTDKVTSTQVAPLGVTRSPS